jgi:hypothetical protein
VHPHAEFSARRLGGVFGGEFVTDPSSVHVDQHEIPGLPSDVLDHAFDLLANLDEVAEMVRRALGWHVGSLGCARQ